MPGSKEIFNAAMNKADSHRWDGQWTEAIKEYQRALEEYPSDSQAHGGLGFSYQQMKQYPQALNEYQLALQNDPHSIIALSKIAEIYTSLNQFTEASDTYLRLANMYMETNQGARAENAWQKAATLVPANPEPHQRLASYYRGKKDTSAAINAYLAAAQIFMQNSDKAQATLLLGEAQALDPQNGQVLSLVERLGYIVTGNLNSSAVSPQSAPVAESLSSPAGQAPGDASSQADQTPVETLSPPAPSARPPLQEDEIEEAFRQAQALNDQGDPASAIVICEHILTSGFFHPEVLYFLGWLYQTTARWDQAIQQYEKIIEDPEYALSCEFSLGQCYKEKGDFAQACIHFDQAVDKVNPDTLTFEEADQFIQLCTEAAEAHRANNEVAQANEIYTALISFLKAQGWQDKITQVTQARETSENTSPAAPVIPEPTAPSLLPDEAITTPVHTDNLIAEPVLPVVPQLSEAPALPPQVPVVSTPDPLEISLDATPSLESPAPIWHEDPELFTGSLSMLELLSESVKGRVKQSLVAIDEYIQKNYLNAAIDECFSIIEIAPGYLDVHLKLGTIYVKKNLIEEAITKYGILIETYLVHHRVDNAIATYHRILALQPDNLTYHVRLSNLLATENRNEEIIAELAAVGDVYLREGQVEKAAGEYEKALVRQPNNIAVRLHYAQALIGMKRLNNALAEYQYILQVDPTNIEAFCHRQIVLTSTANRTAVQEATLALLRLLRSNPQLYEQIIGYYRQAVQANPSNKELHYIIGQMAHITDHLSDALPAYSQAAGDPAKEVVSRYAAAQCLMAMQSPEAAVEQLERAGVAARNFPVDPTLWANRVTDNPEDSFSAEVEILLLAVDAYEQTGKNAEQLETLKQLKEMLPYSEEVYRKLAQVLQRQGDNEGAMETYRELVAYYRKNRQLENAISTLQQMIRIMPSNPYPYTELGDIYINRGYLDDGLKYLRSMADMLVEEGKISEAVPVLQRMANTYWTMGNPDEGFSIFQRAVELVPEDMDVRMELVQLNLQSGRMAEAIEQQTIIARYYVAHQEAKNAVASLQQLIAMDKKNFEAYDLLGQVYSSVGEYDQASRVYRNLIRNDPNNQAAITKLAQIQELKARRP